MPGTVTGASHIKSTKISILGDQEHSVGDRSPKSQSTNRTGEESKMTASQISQNKAKATGVFNLKSILGKGMFGAV